MRRKPAFIKLTRWEHWPTLVYYLPLLPLFFYRSIRAGHPIHYTVTNPGLLFSGNGTESKHQTLALLPEKFRPKSLLVLKTDEIKNVPNRISLHHLDYPVIAKPDIGFRGYLVKKIQDQDQLLSYLNNVREDIIIQEFIPYEKELGIFYHRFPGESNGSITSITIKKFISVTGDGSSTLSELILADDRAFLYHDLFKIIHKIKMDHVYEKGKKITLSVIGNHSKGTQFINGNHLINKDLIAFMDRICCEIDGWYYGRLDIKYENLQKMLAGKSFKILEINGIISEPTHIYDASYQNSSFYMALKSINDHWEIMGKIAIKNHRDYGISYPKVLPYIKNMLWLRSHTKKLRKLNQKDF